MSINELKSNFETNKKIMFKIYSLDYVIELINDRVVIFPIIYESRKSSYSSLDELLNNYLIYGETLIENENRIMKIE